MGLSRILHVSQSFSNCQKEKISKDLIFSGQGRRELGCHLLFLTERRWEPGDLKETDGFKPTRKQKNVKNIRQTLRGVPKKVTNRMLLKPWWTGSVTSSRHLMCLEIVFWSLLSKTNQDQALPSHFVGTIWPHLTQFRLGCFSVSYFILGPLVTVIILQMASRLLRKS